MYAKWIPSHTSIYLRPDQFKAKRVFSDYLKTCLLQGRSCMYAYMYKIFLNDVILSFSEF